MNAKKKDSYSILIVDDESQIADIIRKYLKLYKPFDKIVIAYDGVQAMQKISNQDFDLIITDLVMPNRDGFSLIDNIRKIPRLFNVKMMIVSGCMSREATITAMRKGIRHIVVKPFTARQVLEKCIEALKIDSNPKGLADQLINKVAERLYEKRSVMTEAIPDDKVRELIKNSKGDS